MNTIFAIASLTYKEGLKHRVLFGVLVAALFLMTGALLISGFFMRDIVKVLIDFCLSVTNLGGLLVPFFLTIGMLTGDRDKRTIVTILSQNVSRTQYILGKYFGLSLLTATIMCILAMATYFTLLGGSLLYGEYYFKSLSLYSVATSIVLSYVGISILNGVVFLWCTLTTTSFLATLLTIATYIIGHSIDDVVRFVESPPPGVTVATSIVKAVQIFQYVFPNLAAFDHKLTAAHGLAIPLIDSALLCGYGVSYIAFSLALSVIIFSKRDLC